MFSSFVSILTVTYMSRAVTKLQLIVFSLLCISICIVTQESSVLAVFTSIQVQYSDPQKAIKKLNFNKIIAFIFYHIAKLVIIMLLFTHCTGIFISHCTSYNAKGDINNNTLLLQDRWLHCGHSGPLPFRFLFLCSQFIQRKQPPWILHTVLFFLFFLFFFFCSFFKMQVERRAFNGLSTIPDSPA